MIPGDINEQEASAELVRVLASQGFVKNERMSRFLRFMVERHLQGQENELKESLIGVEVFGRKPGYDPRQDSIVRTEAGRLRARLAEYYAGEGRGNPVIIELPKGGYVPVLRRGVAPDPQVALDARVPRDPWSARGPWLWVAAAGSGLPPQQASYWRHS